MEILSAGGMSIEIAFAEFAASLPPGQKRERGGIVLAIENRLEFQELPNRSRFDNRYIAVVPAIDRLPGPLVGFWHTHLNSPLPSLTDLLQLVRANKRFGQSFALCIAGRRARCMMKVGRFGIPRFRYW